MSQDHMRDTTLQAVITRASQLSDRLALSGNPTDWHTEEVIRDLLTLVSERAIEGRVKQIRTQVVLQERLAKLVCGVAVIKVGVATERD